MTVNKDLEYIFLKFRSERSKRDLEEDSIDVVDEELVSEMATSKYQPFSQVGRNRVTKRKSDTYNRKKIEDNTKKNKRKKVKINY